MSVDYEPLIISAKNSILGALGALDALLLEVVEEATTVTGGKMKKFEKKLDSTVEKLQAKFDVLFALIEEQGATASDKEFVVPDGEEEEIGSDEEEYTEGSAEESDELTSEEEENPEYQSEEEESEEDQDQQEEAHEEAHEEIQPTYPLSDDGDITEVPEWP